MGFIKRYAPLRYRHTEIYILSSGSSNDKISTSFQDILIRISRMKTSLPGFTFRDYTSARPCLGRCIKYKNKEIKTMSFYIVFIYYRRKIFHKFSIPNEHYLTLIIFFVWNIYLTTTEKRFDYIILLATFKIVYIIYIPVLYPMGQN